jgi:hypothetical protein
MSGTGGIFRRANGGSEMVAKPDSVAELERVESIAKQVEAVQSMSMAELIAKYQEVFGVPTLTRNKPYLRKKVGWRIQELAEGGLSPRALAQIEKLAPLAPVRWRTPLPEAKEALALIATPKPKPRDPRLPPPGTVLVRLFRGVEHRAIVLEDGFEYRGERYESLSPIAYLISGTRWNGYLFFNLARRVRGEEAQP